VGTPRTTRDASRLEPKQTRSRDVSAPGVHQDPPLAVGRYYDPTTGQFLSVDPLVDRTGQPYAYVGGNPVNALDPTGLGGILGTGINVPSPGQLLQGAAGAIRSAETYATGALRTDWNALLDTSAAVDSFASAHRGTITTAAAIGVCLTPGVDIVGCGAAAALALSVRVEQRIQEEGFQKSLAANSLDIVTTAFAFELVGLPGAVALGEVPPAIANDFGVSGAAAVTSNGWQLLLVKLGLSGPDVANLGLDEASQSTVAAPKSRYNGLGLSSNCPKT
jgi:hypothetical protein